MTNTGTNGYNPEDKGLERPSNCTELGYRHVTGDRGNLHRRRLRARIPRNSVIGM